MDLAGNESKAKYILSTSRDVQRIKSLLTVTVATMISIGNRVAETSLALQN